AAVRLFRRGPDSPAAPRAVRGLALVGVSLTAAQRKAAQSLRLERDALDTRSRARGDQSSVAGAPSPTTGQPSGAGRGRGACRALPAAAPRAAELRRRRRRESD